MTPVLKHSLPEPGDFKSLRNLAGWDEVDLADAQAALSGSLCGVSLYHDSRIIGMARTVGDGRLNLYIQDLVIHPDYRGQGHGSLLMKALITHLSEAYPQIATIGLMAAEGLDGFYASFGFTPRPSRGFGAGMTASLRTLAKATRQA